MSPRRYAPVLAVAAIAFAAGAIWYSRQLPPRGNRRVPQPQRPVEIDRYLGRWYELARYENGFERGRDGVTAEYRKLPDGQIEVVNRARGPGGTEKVSVGRAKVVRRSGGAKLKVSFFGPFFFGDYWVLDHADDYSWAIVGEPSGRFLWLLGREPHPWEKVLEALEQRAAELGYRPDLIRRTQQGPTAAAQQRKEPPPTEIFDLEEDYEDAE
jgi:apolipoprotein D and lipocalin family protein